MSRKQNFLARYERVREAFSKDDLARVCAMHEDDFADYYGMQYVEVNQQAPANFFLYKDNGADVLAVAHLDTVGPHHERPAQFVETADGLVIFSRALDDRLGAYIILELLPTLGIEYDLLLTVGEEQGQSTAGFFLPPKEYNWMIEFDRGGTDVVLYDYEDDDTIALVKATGAPVGLGAFSDISYMEHLEIKGFNWGVGYQDYHGPRAHAFLEDTFDMVARYLKFHRDNYETYLPHEPGGLSWVRDTWHRKDDEVDDEEFFDVDGAWIPSPRSNPYYDERHGALLSYDAATGRESAEFVEYPTNEEILRVLGDSDPDF